MNPDAEVFEAPGGGKRLSLIQMVLLTHLKAGFEKRGGADYGRLSYTDAPRTPEAI